MNDRVDAAVPTDPGATVRARVEQFDPSARVIAVRDAGGYVVRILSGRFEGFTSDQRRDELGLADVMASLQEQVHTWELLTADEAQWVGELSEAGGEPPVWATALERAEPLGAADATDVLFASDLDEQLESAPVVTFYSLKGGVGRSTAVVATARLLCQQHNLRVLCVDMDLEAPGLASLFGIEDQLSTEHGVLPALLGYEFSSTVPALEHVVPVDESGRLFCLPAGRLGSDYAAQLRTLEPEIWYREQVNPLHRLLDELRDSTLNPDVVLIDSRTGFSPVAAPLLFDVSDMAVVCFHPHAQAHEGTELLTRALLSARTRRDAAVPLTPEPRFVVSPMPPGPSSPRFAERAQGWVQQWIGPVSAAREHRGGLLPEDLTHFVPYDAGVAFADTVRSANDSLEPYAGIADWVVQIVPVAANARSRTRFDKTEVLEQLDFSTAVAEQLQDEEFLDDYVVTRQVSETADPEVPLILGRKGTGKTALFRWLAAGNAGDWRPILVATPDRYDRRPDWSFDSGHYRLIGDALTENGLEWETFWPVAMALALYASAREEVGDLGAPAPAFENLGPGELATAEAVVEVLSTSRGPVACRDWLRRVEELGRGYLLLFDGLDTAFGHSPDQRRRRSAAIAGLLTSQAELSARTHNVRLKIMMRQDIWQSLRFENKSHFFGLQRRLQWEEREEYFKVVLKRAVQAPTFETMLRELDPALAGTPVARWTVEQVHTAWNALVGERMRGQGTAFTANWVWNRLADGNGDHSPRVLLQLFHAAQKWEQSEERRSGYERSVLRPRSLALNLETASGHAVSALLDEEFKELQDLADALRAYGRTPLSEDDLGDVAEELVALAQESGLLNRLPHDGPERLFRVPDLYRWGLGITRRGPI